jgi:hypothetical protein
VTYSIQLSQDTYDLSDLILRDRFLAAVEQRKSSFPFCRDTRFALRRDVSDFFDQLASSDDKAGWHVHRQSAERVIFENDGALVVANGGKKTDYSSCHVTAWATSAKNAENAIEYFRRGAGADLITDPMFSINWHFLDSKRELQSADIEEMADDVLHDEGYPEIEGGVHPFIERYLDSREAVLVLQGPPGTGKTRLIRAILGALSRRNNGQASAIYTGDMKALESDEIFVKFITGWDEAFVVEDADHMLKPRAEGNEHLHRFLTVADGVVRSQGRKIIFSTNLPNVGDLDDALVRPGRCFARVNVRSLTYPEATQLLNRVRIETKTPTVTPNENTKSFTLAEIYKLASS